MRAMGRRDLRAWMKSRPDHRRFTVVSHPLMRAHRAFCSKILFRRPGSYLRIRRLLRRTFGLDIPDMFPDPGYALEDHRKAFEVFLAFLQANLAGQTGVRVDAYWCSQAKAIQGFSNFAPPDFIFRDEDIDRDLPALAQRLHLPPASVPASADVETPYSLSDIYCEDLEAGARAVYQTDYDLFGYEAWQSD